MKSVAIIILSAKKSKDDVAECLKSIERNAYSKKDYEVILVDNASEDDVLFYVRKNFPEVLIIENDKNLGFAAGNNIGIRYAEKKGFKYVVLLNNDTVVEKSWLSELVVAAENTNNFGAIQSKIFFYDKHNVINTDGNIIHYTGFAYCGNYGKSAEEGSVGISEVTYASGASMLIPVDVFKKVGMLQELLFMYHEDVEFGWRLSLSGLKSYVASDSKVYHKYSYEKPKGKKMYFAERNRLIVLLENYKFASLVIFLPAIIFMEIGIIFYSFKEKWLHQKIASYLFFLNPFMLLQIFKNRRKNQKLRVVSDREIIKMFDCKLDFPAVRSPLIQYIANPVLAAYFKLVNFFIFW